MFLCCWHEHGLTPTAKFSCRHASLKSTHTTANSNMVDDAWPLGAEICGNTASWDVAVCEETPVEHEALREPAWERRGSFDRRPASALTCLDGCRRLPGAQCPLPIVRGPPAFLTKEHCHSWLQELAAASSWLPRHTCWILTGCGLLSSVVSDWASRPSFGVSSLNAGCEAGRYGTRQNATRW